MTLTVSACLFKAVFRFILFFQRCFDAPSNHSWPLKVEHMNVDLTDYKWLDKINVSTDRVNCMVLVALMSLHKVVHLTWTWCDNPSPPGALSPLLELFGGDESGPQVAVSHTLGLPPRGVVLGDDLKDVSPLEGKSCFLTGRRLVFQRDVVEQGSHIYLEQKTIRHTFRYLLSDKAVCLPQKTTDECFYFRSPCSPSGGPLLWWQGLSLEWWSPGTGTRSQIDRGGRGDENVSAASN